MGGLEDENPEINPDEESADAKKWMKETMRDLKQRFDDVSRPRKVYVYYAVGHGRSQGDLEQTVTSSLVKMTEGNETRDRKLDDLIKSLSTGLAERERKTERKNRQFGKMSWRKNR